ncbi:MAG: hypothetical protein KVP17_001842 [Porospora cf. gigantea B]|uniref:uncharacterized protein n=1 Tax=Porospora cf. gigantea B TaxID=2853592 RepID=UPI003571BB6A|nr:MAG: hypothetical protein KVP17_001842 [Porospora cf. gigantea B]
MRRVTLTLISLASAACCPTSIDILHVQDASSTFEPLFEQAPVANLVNRITSTLKDLRLGVRYGIARFSDKPAPLVGYGDRWGLWRDYPSRLRQDVCYELLEDIVEDFAPVEIEFVGGKDSEENQFDALARAAIHLGKTKRNTLKVALMVTDGFAHVGKARAFIPKIGYSTTYRALQRHYWDFFGDFRTDWLRYGGLIESDLVMAPSQNVQGRLVRAQIVYRMLVVCQNKDVALDTRASALFRRFASGVAQTLYRQGLSFKRGYDKQEWDTFCNLHTADDGSYLSEGLFGFANSPALIDPDQIVEYPYDSVDDDIDCTLHEYPDPSDPRYAQIFKDNDVLPVILVVRSRPRNRKVFLSSVFYPMASNCPESFSQLMSGASLESLAELHVDCIRRFYTEYLRTLAHHGVDSVLHVKTSDELEGHEVSSTITEMVLGALEHACSTRCGFSVNHHRIVNYRHPVDVFSEKPRTATAPPTPRTATAPPTPTQMPATLSPTTTTTATTATASTTREAHAAATTTKATSTTGQTSRGHTGLVIGTATAGCAALVIGATVAAVVAALHSSDDRPEDSNEQPHVEMEEVERERVMVFESKIYG